MNNKLSINNIFEQEKKDLRSVYSKPKYYINREHSWMEFNKRVLFQAIRKNIPLIERLKFLGISASNLDEFLMVRFSSILNKIRRDDDSTEISGLTPEEEYDLIFGEIFKFKETQEEVYTYLRKKMKKHNHMIVKYKKLSELEKTKVDKLFFNNIYPLLTPITIDTTKDFPVIHSKQLCIVIGLEDKLNANLNVVSLIPIHKNGLDRLYSIVGDNGERKYILLEEIIYQHLNRIFMNKNIVYKGCMRLVREADITLEDNEDVYIVDRMRQILMQRENSMPIFMDVSSDIPKSLLKLLIKIFEINKKHVYKTKSILDLSFFAGKPIRDSLLEYGDFEPQYPEELIGEHDMFSAINNNDIVLHHPYESFGPVEKFLEHAAEDKSVLAIKQTLYRVSSEDSTIVESLCRAAKKGKQVTVLLEIKARFDEDRNISLVEKLKNAGCNVTYGLEDLKTHCKFILVIKKTNKGLKYYTHIGTGNYNSTTSKFYTDLSYFTSNTKIGDDINSVFNILSGFSSPKDEINKISYSPFNIRTKLYSLIEREIKNAEKGKPAVITLKLNSLSDKGIIRNLYRASEKGVTVNIVCRGICSMKPINKNIKIRSIVGRYLEHSRIYFFFNNGNSDIFISSADMLTRNLDRRVEILVPLNDNETREKVFNILKRYFNDTVNTFIMDKEGRFNIKEKEIAEFNIHDYFMSEAISNYKFRKMPKIDLKHKKK